MAANLRLTGKTVALFGFAVLACGQFAPVIVVSPAYSVESIGGGIESIAKSRDVLVTKNISITYISTSKDGCPLMNLPIIRQAGRYLRERFRFGRIARTDYSTFEDYFATGGKGTGQASHH